MRLEGITSECHFGVSAYEQMEGAKKEGVCGKVNKFPMNRDFPLFSYFSVLPESYTVRKNLVIVWF